MRGPCYFLSHGGPTILKPNSDKKTEQVWKELGENLSAFRGIIFVSAHWYGKLGTPVSFNFTSNTTIIHDFGEFFPGIYDIKYDPVSFAAKEKEELFSQGQEVDRGFDHGVWVPLHVMGLRIPILQIQLPSQEPEVLTQLGKALAGMRDQGYALVASGGSVHNLPHTINKIVYGNSTVDGTRVEPWAVNFEDYLFHQCLSKPFESAEKTWMTLKESGLLEKCHPTVEHLVPLFVALGASTTGKAQRFANYFNPGEMGMHIYEFD
jgi:4,5-DOPA dioxygenase extradiol